VRQLHERVDADRGHALTVPSGRRVRPRAVPLGLQP